MYKRIDTKIYESVFREKIYGNNAIVYHRTHSKDLINNIFITGFQPGGGNYYGKGFYATYDLESQLGRDMKANYGDLIVKFQVALNNFFFYDFDVFVTTPLYKEALRNKEILTEDNFLLYQLELLGIQNQKYIQLFINNKNFKMTSDLAKDTYSYISSLVSGIIFTGRHDGRVLVCYDVRRIIPLSFSVDEGKTFEKITNKSINYIKDALTIKDSERKKKSIPDFIEKAKISKGASFYWDTENISDFVWEDGKWLKGTWEDGTWEYGIWEDGEWKQGTWKAGIWVKGRWSFGQWHSGIWKKGNWQDGIWRNGQWDDGYWDDGYWQDGIWHGGEWFKGTWLGGEWKKGTWKDGTWKDGAWMNGVWEDGKWENGEWKNGTWFKGTWEYGTWDKGEWRGGKWIKGKILNKNTDRYEESSVNPNECEWSYSYQKA
jgi:hypothetical protein